MFMKRQIAQSLIALQVVTSMLGFVVHADESVPPTAEEILLSQAYSIEATAQNKEDVQAQLTYSIQNYLDTAPTDGRETRLVDAMVQMKLATAADAANMMQAAEASESKLTSEHFASDQEASAAVTSEVQQLLANSPAQGAQFSRCDFSPIGYGFLVAGISGLGLSIVLLPSTNVSRPVANGVLYGSGGALALAFTFAMIAGNDCD